MKTKNFFCLCAHRFYHSTILPKERVLQQGSFFQHRCIHHNASSTLLLSLRTAISNLILKFLFKLPVRNKRNWYIRAVRSGWLSIQPVHCHIVCVLWMVVAVYNMWNSWKDLECVKIFFLNRSSNEFSTHLIIQSLFQTIFAV